MSKQTQVSLPWLDPRDPTQDFPPTSCAMHEPNGLLAIGGDLSPARLLRAYSRGIFPWYNPDEPILWWSPSPRAVFDLSDIHVSRRFVRTIRKNDYTVTLDRAFDDVVAACAGPRDGDTATWLGHDMRMAYSELHALGHGHSIEVWREGTLIGGLYGIALGGVFFGESMFSAAPEGSKRALYWLRHQLAEWGFALLDCQVGSDHLYSLGAKNWPRARFERAISTHAMHTFFVGEWTFTLPVPSDQQHLPEALRV